MEKIYGGKVLFIAMIMNIIGQPLLLYMENSSNNASALFSDATADELVASGGISLIADSMKRLKIQVVENQIIPSLSYGYFICEPNDLISNIKGFVYDEKIGSVPKLYFQSDFNEAISPSSLLLPVKVCTRDNASDLEFDLNKFYNNLSTKSLGKILLYVPISETTMNISKSMLVAFPSYDGILVISSSQTRGYGRLGNQWLSPNGSAIFSFNFNIPLQSNLGQSPTFIQHILAVSIVDAVINILDIKEFPLKIKWPNDIYYNRLFKLGGILVESSISSNILHCIIGAGINVSNSKPTVCLNDMIPDGCDKVLSVEEVLAKTMNKFESWLFIFC